MKDPNAPPAIWPFALAYACNGAIVSMPGANFTQLMTLAHWTPADFGMALLLQGSFSYLGTRFVSSHLAKLNVSRRLAVCAILQGLGLLLIYSPSPTYLRALGFALVGLSVGNISILGSLAALKSHLPQKKLNQLNLAFTGGAVLIPMLTSALLQLNTQHFDWRWPLMPALLSLGLLLTRGVLQKDDLSLENKVANETVESATVKAGFLHSLPLTSACFALFLYVGIEINLSNSWVGLMPEKTGLSLSSWASPLFWSGLFISRLIFSFYVPAQKNLSKYLICFASGTLLCLVILGLVRSVLFLDNASLSIALCAAFLSGLSIGSSYSFILGAVTHTAPKGYETAYASRTSEWGVLGTIVLPPMLGFAEQIGHKNGVLTLLMGSVLLLLLSNFGMQRSQRGDFL
jgi:MFS family permease